MAKRTYGVKSGAGTTVTEEDARGALNPSAFGATCLVGVADRGDPTKLIEMIGPKQVPRRLGGRRDDSLVRYGADDFWGYSGGAGKLYAVRVTDGAEVESEITLYGRTTAVAQREIEEERPAHAGALVEVLKVKAKDGGRWAGRRRVEAIDELPISGNVDETTIITGRTMVPDELKGAYILLVGSHDTSGSRRYEVVSNTTTALTVKSGSTMLTDLTGGVAQTTVGVVIFLDPLSLSGTRTKGVAVKLREGALKPLTEFGLELYLDGERVRYWSDLSMDPASARYAVPLINDDAANEEIVVTDLLAQNAEITELNRPGNFTAQIVGVTSTSVRISPFRVKSNSVPAKIVPVAAAYDVSLLTGGTLRPVRTVMKFTWDATNTKFVVAVDDTAAPGVFAGNLPDWTITTPAYAEVYDPSNPWLPKVTIDLLADPADGDVFEILVSPASPDMVGGKAFPDVDGSQYTGLVVRDATHDVLTVESGDPSAYAMPAGVATVVGTVAGDDFTFAAGASDVVTIAIDGRAPLAITLTGANQTAAQVVTQINDAFDAVYGAGVLNPATSSVGGLVLTSPGGFDGGGAGSKVEIVAVANDAYTVLGLAAGVEHGIDGTRARVEYAQTLTGGYDGVAPVLADYMAVVAASTSPINDADGANAGNIMVVAPGLSEILSASDLAIFHKQASVYCESKPYVYLAETPKAYEEAATLAFWSDSVGRSDMLAPYAPALGYVQDPDALGRTKLVSLLPMIAGLWAKRAAENSGYHKPAAGIDAKLLTVISLPETQKALDQELLTPAGVNALRYRAGSWVVWGAWTLHENSKWRQLSNRMQMNHYIATFATAFDWVIFRLNDKKTWGAVKSVMRDYLRNEWANRVLTGDKEKDAFTIKIDADNNPQSQIDLGNAHLDIEFNLAKFVERLKIGVGATGISEVA